MGNTHTHEVEGIKSLISKEEIDRIVHGIADDINKNYKDNENLVLLCILPDAAMFMADLSRNITVPHEHRYFHMLGIPDLQIKGKDVIIVDTGLILSQGLIDIISENAPASMEICTFLNPNADLNVPVKYNISALDSNTDDSILVGYGLDYNGHYRGLPYIGELTFDSSESNDADTDEDCVPSPEDTDEDEDEDYVTPPEDEDEDEDEDEEH
jgi:hypoxanthine phosphoribosyltransferase